MLSNRKQMSMAVGGSLLLHVLLLLLWATAVQWLRPAKRSTPTPPLQLQIVKAEETPPQELEETPTPTPIFRPFIDTTSRAPSDHPSATAKFESGQDTQAASLLPAAGDQPLPSQDGKKSPVFAFDTTAYTPGDAPVLAMSGPSTAPVAEPEVPPPDAAPTPRPATPTPAPSHTPVPDDEFGLPAPTPTPEDTEPPFDPAFRGPALTSPPRPSVVARSANRSDAAGFQADEATTSVSGNIGKRGEANVDSIGTPVGRYQNMVVHAIKVRWTAYFYSRGDVVSLGMVRIHLVIDRNGRVLRPRVLANSSNEALATVSMQAIMDAAIPPMPADAFALMRGGELSMDLTFNAE